MSAVPRRLLGLVFAVIGLVSQIALGALALPDAPTPEQRLAAMTVACQPGRPKPPEPARHAPDQAPDAPTCPLGAALALPSVVPTPAPTLPPPPAAVIGRAGTAARPRAPPLAVLLAAQPRGPPALS